MHKDTICSFFSFLPDLMYYLFRKIYFLFANSLGNIYTKHLSHITNNYDRESTGQKFVKLHARAPFLNNLHGLHCLFTPEVGFQSRRNTLKR